MPTLESRRRFLATAAGFAALGLNLPVAIAQSRRPPPSGASEEHFRVLDLYRRLVSQAPSRLDALDPRLALELYRALITHPVASTDRLPQYDPEGAIGFCFGRDMTAFLLGRLLGLKIEAMRSLFAIGDLRSGAAPEWRFHVTKIVRLNDGRWIALDPIVPQHRPLSVQQWITTVQEIWDRPRRAKFYVTSPDCVLPDVRRMAMPDQETGQEIIELRFNPAGKPGIRPATVFARGEVTQPVFELDAQAGHRYFLSTNEPAPETFPFDSLTINDLNFSFRGFFSDLVSELAGRRHPLQASQSPARTMGTMSTENPQGAGARQGPVARPSSSFGMTFGPEFYRGRGGRR